MPVEVKQHSAGIVVMYWGGEVTADDLSAGAKRRDEAVGSAEGYIFVLENIRVTNPLLAVKSFVPYIDPRATHTLLVNRSPMAAVIAERLAQLSPGLAIETFPTLPQAIDRAKELAG